MANDTDGQIPDADIHMIQRIIPHRYPFLFVDRVEEIVANVSATGIKNVTFNEPHFQGHFPEAPIMPGVTIIEAMAQTAGVLVGMSNDLVDRKALIYFMSVDNAKFRRKVVPGDVLKLHVQVTRGTAGAKVWKFHGEAKVDGEMACSADFAAMIDLSKESA
ncbi:3-hydroxyacyl-[acyl-carrier-protein] dehydratase FabZ [Jannaschia seosinensis]|uniref:3-hydroxyacyl-[acyl-carrier-protein] dehydratase FabZ n=1 Tax=Jannaschia seosinensis TaxID=313367 RepID=A0A0M7BE79_9RHOB|nr:3-hydroxyacyl-ACP dehydratase FabZ [Jannaschia seosinensis]CUH41030.1 3-hydroxyacyl-[acyl-carrier-protein] dehydratase FabZ [Jannaschia seosinensis]